MSQMNDDLNILMDAYNDCGREPDKPLPDLMDMFPGLVIGGSTKVTSNMEVFIHYT